MAIFYDIVGPAAGGTGTAKASVNSAYKVPDAARELVGLYSFAAAEAPSAADSILAVGTIEGNDMRYQPCEWLYPVASGKLGAIDQLDTTPMEFWEMHVPLKGSETLDITVEPCSAIATDNFEVGVTMVYSTVPLNKPVIYGKFSRETATGTTAATVTACTSLTLSNALKMVEVIGVMVSGTGTVVADEECAGYFTMSCTQWDPIQQIKFFHEPMHAIEATTGRTVVKSIARLPFDARFKSTQATIDVTAYNYDALSGAGVYVHGLRYLGTK
jgi:hypothetical protein